MVACNVEIPQNDDDEDEDEDEDDFEIRTLLLRVYRRSEDYDIPEGGSDSFDIEAVPEDVDAIEA